MQIKWKQQHLNNSCASACLAMLLSNFGIDKEDLDVIAESKMPFLLKYEEEGDSFSAGMLVQESGIFNFVVSNYGLKFFQLELQNRDEYFSKARELSESNIPFMTGISSQHLYPFSHKNNLDHAIVVDDLKDNSFHILNPDTVWKEISNIISKKLRKMFLFIFQQKIFKRESSIKQVKDLSSDICRN